MTANVGWATLSVIPSFKGFQSNLERGMAAPMVAASTRAGATSGTAAAKGFTSKFQTGITGLGPRMIGALGVGALGKQVIDLQGDFESSMNVLAESADVPAAKMAELSEFAKEMGASTVFSAGEAADAMVELAKAGMSPAQIEAGALSATMAVAATEGLGLAESATIMSNAMTTFRIEGERATEVADALAGGSKASTASVASLSEAMSQVGGSARDAGLSLQETVAALSAFDQEGIKGSDAGTSLKTMLQRLVPQTSRARKEMERLDLAFTDSTGTFLPLAEIAGQLQGAFSKLSDAERTSALNTIFGADARRAALALIDQGASGIEKFTEATSDMGAAQRLADARMSGTKGALEEMKGALEGAGLAAGEFMAPGVVAAADGVAALTNAVVDLPAPVKAAAGAFVALKLAARFGPTDGIGRLSGAMDGLRIRSMLAADAFRTARAGTLEFAGNSGRFIAPVGRMSATLQGLGAAATGAGASLRRGLSGAIGMLGGPWGAALVGGTALLTAFWSQQQKAKQRVEDLTATLDEQTGALTENSAEWAANLLNDSGALEAARKLGINLETVTQAALGNAAAMTSVRDAVTEAREAGQGGLATDVIREVSVLRGVVEEGAAEWQLFADATGRAGDAADGAADAFGRSAAASYDAAGKAEDYANRIDQARQAIQDLIDKEQERADNAVKRRRDELGLIQALQDTRGELNEGRRTLDLTTEAGQKNREALYDLAEQWNQSSEKIRSKRGAYRDIRDDFIELATAMGGGDKSAAAEARRLARELLKIPKPKIDTSAIDRAKEKVAELEYMLDHLDQGRKISLGVSGLGVQGARANGGPVNAGSAYLVGERGPEIIVPNRAGNVLTAEQSRGIGGNTINVTVVADDPWAWKREMEHMTRSGALGGADFR